MKNYFISTTAGREGPFTIEDLKNKNLKRSTQVWCHPMKDWMPAGELPELEEIFSMIPPEVKSAGSSQSRPAPSGPTQIMPRTWLVESILVMLFCCLPFGIAGLIYATRVDSKFYQGDYAGAEQASREAGRWTKIGFWLAIAFYSVMLILALLGVTAGIFASLL